MRSLKRLLEFKTLDAKDIERELERIRTYKHWEVCGHKNLNAYLTAELGYGQRQLRARLAKDLAADPDVKPLALPGEIGGGHTGRGSNTTSGHAGRGANYLVRRLKRDHKEIAAALARGEYPSARAAGIAAGICKPPSLHEQVIRALPKLTREERDDIANRIREMNFISNGRWS
jgi:hypothetical protein